MNKMKIKLFFLCFLFTLNGIKAQQSFAVMSDSTITNFIEDELISAYGYIDVLADYRDSTFKRSLLIYQKTATRYLKVCASKEELERMHKHILDLEGIIVKRDKRLEYLIEDAKTRLVESTLEKYRSRISKQEKLSLIINRDKILYTNEEVIDVTNSLITLLQKEQEKIEEIFEIEMKSIKEEFQEIVSNEEKVR